MPGSPASRIPWSRALVEGGVIVLSILLAFAIDAGWDNAREAAARRAALQDLRDELGESLPLMDTTLVAHGAPLGQ